MGGRGTRWQALDLRPREGPAVWAPKVLQYTFAMGQNDKESRATIELVPETEATRVTVTHDEWARG
jgi:Activator of Hsp90 ATPase homolog 1-like protein